MCVGVMSMVNAHIRLEFSDITFKLPLYVFSPPSNDLICSWVKNARYNPFGDVYEPKPNIKDEFDPSEYYEPIKNHSHASNCQWYRDIDYYCRTKRLPALLVGDPSFSFLWSRPMILLTHTATPPLTIK